MNQAYAKSCFIAGTRITMADGSTRPIETLRVGERVLDQHGGSNRILALERVILGKRRLYGINDLPPFFTAEHPLLTTRGWAAISPAMTRTENPQLAVLPLFTGMQIMCRPAPAMVTGNLALQSQPELLLVESLCWIEASPTTALFNLLLDGSHSYIANELIVHNKDGGGGDSGGGSNSSGGSNSGGQGEHAGGEPHGGGERHAGGEKHAGGERHGGGRGFGNGIDDNGVDAVDANGNKLRGDGTIDDNGVDAVDANGNKLRGDGTVDDRQQVLTDEQERALLNNGFRQQGQP
ncbi:hypothetical protein ACSZNT_17440 [Aeromonas veronii]